MTVKQLKEVLKDLNLRQRGDGNAKKDLQLRLLNWIHTQRREGSGVPSQQTVEPNQPNQNQTSKRQTANSSKQKQQKGTVILETAIEQPAALQFHSNSNLLVADQETKSILELKLTFNDIDNRASPLRSIGCHSQAGFRVG